MYALATFDPFQKPADWDLKGYKVLCGLVPYHRQMLEQTRQIQKWAKATVSVGKSVLYDCNGVLFCMEEGSGSLCLIMEVFNRISSPERVDCSRTWVCEESGREELRVLDGDHLIVASLFVRSIRRSEGTTIIKGHTNYSDFYKLFNRQPRSRGEPQSSVNLAGLQDNAV